MKIHKIQETKSPSQPGVLSTVVRKIGGTPSKVLATLPDTAAVFEWLAGADLFNRLGAAFFAILGEAVDGRPIVMPITTLTHHDKRGRLSTRFGTAVIPASADTDGPYLTSGSGVVVTRAKDVQGTPWANGAVANAWDHFVLLCEDGSAVEVPVTIRKKADGTDARAYGPAEGFGFRDDDGDSWNVRASILPRMDGSVRMLCAIDQTGAAVGVESTETDLAYVEWAYGTTMADALNAAGEIGEKIGESIDA